MSVLLVLSTIIATAGLLSDSAAVVIGAMLVALMMTPLMAAAGAVVMGWSLAVRKPSTTYTDQALFSSI
jgi:uncharacterized membrane protein